MIDRSRSQPLQACAWECKLDLYVGELFRTRSFLLLSLLFCECGERQIEIIAEEEEGIATLYLFVGALNIAYEWI